MELSSSCCAEIGVPLDLRRISESLGLPKEGKPLVVSDVEHRMALDPMQGNQASSRVDLAYTEQFRIPAVTSLYV